MRKAHGFAPLGAADGPVKSAVFGLNAARLYRLNLRADLGRFGADTMAAIKAEYAAAGGQRSNAAYGYVARRA
jgi:hypothetical protein